MLDIKKLDINLIVKSKERIKQYLDICLKENVPNITDEDVEKYFSNMEKFTEEGSAIVIGAFWDNVLVGFQWAYEVEYGGEKRLHSSFDCVDPQFQRRKIGTQMMEKLEEIARNKGITSIEAMCTAANKKAVEYHLNNGFEIERYKVVKKLS